MPRPAKYTAVAAQLQARIDARTYAPGESLPPEQELARQFGVNRLTLRKAVGLLVAEGLVVRRQGSGSFVQADSRRGLRKASLLYVGSTTEHFFQSFYDALCREAARRGKGVTAFTPGSSPESLAQLGRLARSHRRMICVNSLWTVLRQAIPAEVRVTRVSGFDSLESRQDGPAPVYSISTDTYRAVKLAVEYLAGLGHRRIGYVDAGRSRGGDPLDGEMAPDRVPFLGYKAGLQECGLPGAPVLALPFKLLQGVREFQEPHYRFFARQLSDARPIPTAFICVGDFRAGPLIRVLREHGLHAPGDVSLVGIGNTPWSQALDPPLTSVCLGEEEMARLAMLLDEEDEPGPPRVVCVDPELVIRHSSGPAPHQTANP